MQENFSDPKTVNCFLFNIGQVKLFEIFKKARPPFRDKKNYFRFNDWTLILNDPKSYWYEKKLEHEICNMKTTF